jgi:hypothetical protein
MGWLYAVHFARTFMKTVAVVLLLGMLSVGGSVEAFAQTRTGATSQSRASRKAGKKQQKAQKKYAKAQRKAQRKMLKTERKNTRYPARRY